MQMGWGSSAKAAIESSYGTSKAGAATWNWLELVSEGIESDRQVIISRALTQVQGARKAAPGVFLDQGPLTLELGPENALQLLYCAFGTVNTTTLAAYTPNLYSHAFTLGSTLPSFELKIDTKLAAAVNTVIRHLSGISVDAITFTGAMDSALMLALGLRVQKEGTLDEAMGTITLPAEALFTPIIGSITIGGSAFTNADNWVVTINRNPAYRPRWGTQFLAGAGPGRCIPEISWNLYFETVAECNRFLGDYAHTMATRNTPADTLESADIHINAENGEDAGTAQPFTFLLDLPRVYWRTSGPYIEGEDAVRQPMVGIAMHNTADGWPIKCEIVNTVEAADVIA